MSADRREASPRFLARMAGFAYLLLTLVGGVALFAGRRLVVSGDAAATAANILAHKPLFWLGFAGWLIQPAIYLVVTMLFYELFKPVSRRFSLLAAFFSLVGCGLQAVCCVFYAAPSILLDGGHYATVFRTEQLQALAFMLLKLFTQCYNLGLVFFGFYCLLIGYLAYKSTFLPRFLGPLVMLTGLGGLTFLWPPLASALLPFNLATGFGEILLALWFLVAGVNAERWKEQLGSTVRYVPDKAP